MVFENERQLMEGFDFLCIRLCLKMIGIFVIINIMVIIITIIILLLPLVGLSLSLVSHLMYISTFLVSLLIYIYCLSDADVPILSIALFIFP